MEKEDFYSLLRDLESENDFNEKRRIVKMLPKHSDTFSKVKIVVILSYKILILGRVETKKKEFETAISNHSDDKIELSMQKYLSFVFNFTILILVAIFILYKTFF